MNKDIRIKLSFSTHRKRKKLERILGPRGVLCLLNLWSKVAEHRPKGILTGMTEEDIALDAQWPKEPERFCQVLLEVGFMDRGEDGTYSIHDWREHQGFAFFAQERSERAQLAAKRRWTKKTQIGIENEDMREPLENKEIQDATGMLSACDQHTSSNAPSPTPSPTPSPIPIPKKESVALTGHLLKMDVKEMVGAWNEICGPLLPKVLSFPKRRESAIKARMKERPNLEEWKGIFQKVISSPFLRGENDKGWRADFDWVLNPSNLAKIIEGKYDDRSNANKPKIGLDAVKNMLAEIGAGERV